MLLAMEIPSVLHVGGSCLLVSDIFISRVEKLYFIECDFSFCSCELKGEHKGSMFQSDTELMSQHLCRLSRECI